MRQFIKSIAIFISLYAFSHPLIAGPWFTGPLLAPAGHTVPRGHTNFEMYGIDVFTDAQYNQQGHLVSSPLFKTFVANPILTHGFTDWLDVQVTLPYAFNSTRGVNYNRLTDVSTAVGIQLLEQKGSPKRADLRLLIQEIFPTGKFEDLDPLKLGTDSTGLGSYQTQVGINLQYLLNIYNEHYLRTRLILAKLYYTSVGVHGLNSYGGSPNTNGRINPGTEGYIDLAFEYTLTQNWVAVMEGTLSTGVATRFNGILTTGNIGGPMPSIGSDDYKETALAPALEYNFNANIGLIGGVWFPISGKNTSHYTTYILALNMYW